MRQEATLAQWEALYKAAQAIKQQAPWTSMNEGQLIAIQRTVDDVPVFCSVLGKEDGHCGVELYEGDEGLASYEMFEHMDETGLSEDYVLGEQTMLCLYFGNRDEVPNDQKKIIKELGLSFRGNGNWPCFVSYQRRYAPCSPDARETQVLHMGLENVVMAVDRLREKDMQVAWDKGEILCRTYDARRASWVMFPTKRPSGSKPYPRVQLTEEDTLRHMKQAPQNRQEIMLDFVYMHTWEKAKNGERPRNTLALLAVDAASGDVLRLERLAPDEMEYEAALRFLIDYVKENGRMRCIRARSPWVFAALADTAKACKIRLIPDTLKKVDQVLTQEA